MCTRARSIAATAELKCRASRSAKSSTSPTGASRANADTVFFWVSVGTTPALSPVVWTASRSPDSAIPTVRPPPPRRSSSSATSRPSALPYWLAPSTISTTRASLPAQPVPALGVEPLDRLAGEPGQAERDVEAQLGLDVAQVPVARREAGQQPGLEQQRARRVEHEQPVLLVDRLAAGDPPGAVLHREEVVEAPDAVDVHLRAVDHRALEDGHLGL